MYRTHERTARGSEQYSEHDATTPAAECAIATIGSNARTPEVAARTAEPTVEATRTTIARIRAIGQALWRNGIDSSAISA